MWFHLGSSRMSLAAAFYMVQSSEELGGDAGLESVAVVEVAGDDGLSD